VKKAMRPEIEFSGRFSQPTRQVVISEKGGLLTSLETDDGWSNQGVAGCLNRGDEPSDPSGFKSKIT